jgi:hypothetical protein
MSGGLLYEQSSGNLKFLYSVEESMKESLRSVVIPADVSIIRKKCFCRCRSLCEITFESGIELQRIE